MFFFKMPKIRREKECDGFMRMFFFEKTAALNTQENFDAMLCLDGDDELSFKSAAHCLKQQGYFDTPDAQIYFDALIKDNFSRTSVQSYSNFRTLGFFDNAQKAFNPPKVNGHPSELSKLIVVMNKANVLSLSKIQANLKVLINNDFFFEYSGKITEIRAAYERNAHYGNVSLNECIEYIENQLQDYGHYVHGEFESESESNKCREPKFKPLRIALG